MKVASTVQIGQKWTHCGFALYDESRELVACPLGLVAANAPLGHSEAATQAFHLTPVLLDSRAIGTAAFGKCEAAVSVMITQPECGMVAFGGMREDEGRCDTGFVMIPEAKEESCQTGVAYGDVGLGATIDLRVLPMTSMGANLTVTPQNGKQMIGIFANQTDGDKLLANPSVRPQIAEDICDIWRCDWSETRQDCLYP